MCVIPQLVRRSVAEVDGEIEVEIEGPETGAVFESDFTARERRLYVALAIAIVLNLLLLFCGVTFVVLTWKR